MKRTLCKAVERETWGKRLFDVAGAAGGLAAFSPVMLLIAMAILLDDGRPIFFRQERLGRARRGFSIVKFRSMRDGSVTRVGRLLRATGLDELPQFVNILRGDMSAVGPRPLTAADVERLGWERRRYDFRWRMRPGLTGLAQVVGASSSRQSASLDRYYVARQGVLLDVRLVAASFAVNVFGKTRVRHRLRRRRNTSPAGRSAARSTVNPSPSASNGTRSGTATHCSSPTGCRRPTAK